MMCFVGLILVRYPKSIFFALVCAACVLLFLLSKWHLDKSTCAVHLGFETTAEVSNIQRIVRRWDALHQIDHSSDFLYRLRIEIKGCFLDNLLAWRSALQDLRQDRPNPSWEQKRRKGKCCVKRAVKVSLSAPAAAFSLLKKSRRSCYHQFLDLRWFASKCSKPVVCKPLVHRPQSDIKQKQYLLYSSTQFYPCCRILLLLESKLQSRVRLTPSCLTPQPCFGQYRML